MKNIEHWVASALMLALYPACAARDVSLSPSAENTLTAAIEKVHGDMDRLKSTFEPRFRSAIVAEAGEGHFAEGWKEFWKCWWERDFEGDEDSMTGGCWDKHMLQAREPSSEPLLRNISTLRAGLGNEQRALQTSYENLFRTIIENDVGEGHVARGWAGFWKCWWDRCLEGDDASFTAGCWERHFPDEK